MEVRQGKRPFVYRCQLAAPCEPELGECCLHEALPSQKKSPDLAAGAKLQEGLAFREYVIPVY